MQSLASNAVPAAAFRAGIFSDGMIEDLLAAGAIRPAMPLVEGQIQPASLDLRLAGAPGASARAFCRGRMAR